MTESTLGYWEICGWFMLGVALLQVYRLLTFVAKPPEQRQMTIKQCLALKGQGLIVGFAGSWIWVSGHAWKFLQGLDTPLLDKIDLIKADQLGSVLAGFALELILLDRIVGWLKPKKKST
jgi:hypothetical protein